MLAWTKAGAQAGLLLRVPALVARSQALAQALASRMPVPARAMATLVALAVFGADALQVAAVHCQQV